MGKNSITEITPQELVSLINDSVNKLLVEFKKDVLSQKFNEELLTRKEACEFLKIDSSTLWAWTKKGKVSAYGIANRRYYKRCELMQSLKLLKNQSNVGH